MSTSVSIFPRSRPWQSLDLIGGLTRSDILLPDEELKKHVALLEFDMNTEYDSENFCVYLEHRAKKGMTFTPEFADFEKTWRRDELNHYLGYRRLLAMCGPDDEVALHRRVTGRPVNFAPIEDFLRDEFSICLVLAYDEITTANSCRMDFSMFSSFGNPIFLEWIRRVARDEAYHFLNIVDVIKRRHAHRIPEARPFLKKLLNSEGEGKAYGSTFVMDHDPDRFPHSVLEKLVEKVLKAIVTTEEISVDVGVA